MSVNSDTLLSKIELVSTKLVTIKMLEIILEVKSLQDSICEEEYLYHRDMSIMIVYDNCRPPEEWGCMCSRDEGIRGKSDW
jgi:hypothetical protein